MKGKPIRIDWDRLEEAFDNRSEELVYYLDTVTGRVHLDGEGDVDDDDMDVSPSAPAPRRPDSTRLLVESPGDDVESGWIREFVDGSGELDALLTERLRRALEAESPLLAFRAALHEQAELRDRWFLFHSTRLQRFIEEWVARHEIVSTEPPPWKS